MKRYTLKVKKPEYWEEIHNSLCNSSSCEHIPDREVLCCDEMEHSETRGTFELEEDEVELLKNNEMIEWIEVSPIDHPGEYPEPHFATQRFKAEVKIYRDLDTYGPTGIPTALEKNRTNWAIKRVGITSSGDFWPGITGAAIAPKLGDVSYSLTGKNVDVIIQDAGVLQYHPEFLDYKGQSRVRDVVLDGPYYIDPDYFNNVIPGVKYTKADGRVGIATTSAEEWWENGSKRSAQFASIGTVLIPSTYTVATAMGGSLDGTNSLTDGHGTACAGLAAGKTMGLAFEANIWNMPGISAAVGSITIAQNFDLMKLFHKYKPVNPVTGVKNPTVINGSWGYQAAFSAADVVGYKFRSGIGTFLGNSATTDQVTAMKNGLNNQVSGAYKSWSTSSRSNSTNSAGNELMASGVIYVAAAGNNNQRLGVGANDPDRLNYMEDEYFGSGDPRSEFGGLNVPCNHRDWMVPQGIGFNTTSDFHPVICVGAMDDSISAITLPLGETKASYSNNGPGIDVWAPADETLAPGTNNVTGYTDYQRYDDTRFYDCYFNGTSAAAPVVTGLVALYLETNPRATQLDVKNWIRTNGSITVAASIFLDRNTDDTLTAYWTDTFNLRGATRTLLYNPFANDTQPSMSGITASGISFTQT